MISKTDKTETITYRELSRRVGDAVLMNNTMQFIENTSDGLFAVIGPDYTARCFEDRATYQAWKEATEKYGHSMQTFYMIKKMISQYSPWNEADIAKYL